MFQRIQHFFNTLATNWSEDPGARGAAKMTAAGVLVAEGVFGVVRGRTGRNGRRQRGGILGGVLGIIFGIIFINVGGFVEGSGIDDPVEITGEVVAVERAGTSGENDTPMYRTRIAYTVDGESYEFSPRGRSSWRPNVGADVDVAYSRSNPANAKRIGGIEEWAPQIFGWAGWFVIVTSAFSLLVSIALIVFGIWLFQQGRADRRLSGEDRGFFGDLFAIARDVRAGNMDIAETAAGMAGAAQGSGQPAAAAPAQPAANAASAPAATASAPAGWMLDPADESMLRWWDGQQFTELRRPRD
ncbi:DUF3592 domain-containing protein [Saliniramus sp.]|uniref:DUF3592 domain-containing protein n=1 Tax=Saliniramus sp. TaxID=2986772 RepID=UPI002CF6CE84|nr:DUF3592 domain-containing protein [Saliniramus sp.]HMB09407.1 DUF3592 domain-containing protein [Saliniramus sp.]